MHPAPLECWRGLRAVGRATQSVVFGRWFHDEMVVDLGCETAQAEGLAKVPTMILFETRGLQLFWVVRGGIRSNGRLSAEASAHHGLIPSSILSLEPERRKSRWDYHLDINPENLLGVCLADVQAACAFRCCVSKRPPFFQRVSVMAAILRASVRRAISGFMPLASKAR